MALELHVTLADSATVITDLPRSFARSWQDPMSDTGNASFKLLLNDPDIDEVLTDRWVRFILDGVNVFTMIVERDARETLAQGEDGAQFATVKGRGIAGSLDTIVTYPSLGPGVKPIELKRPWDWTSTAFDHGDWDFASAIALASSLHGNDAPNVGWRDVPFGWVYGGAYWLWAEGGSTTWADPGPCLFWSPFTFPADYSRLAVFHDLDAGGAIFIDGQLVFQSDVTFDGYLTMQRTDLEITPGEHEIAILCTNNRPIINTVLNDVTYTVVWGDTLFGLAERFYHSGGRWYELYAENAAVIDAAAAGAGKPGGGHYLIPGIELNIPNGGSSEQTSINPGGILVSGWTVHPNTNIAELVFATDSTWLCVGYPGSAPGMTPGEIIMTLLDERLPFDPSIADITIDFTATLDSGGNLWPVVTDFVTPVGMHLLDVLRQLSETYVDWHMAPGSRNLSMWNIGTKGSDLSASASYSETDVEELGHEFDRKIVNAVLMLTDDGWKNFEHQDSIDTYGRREVSLEAGWIKETGEAWRVATNLFDLFAIPRVASSIRIPILDTLGAGDPYFGWDIGDSIEVPDENLDPATQRVLALSGHEDDDGYLWFVPQLNSIIVDQAEAWQRWLKRMDSGALAGDTWIPSPSAPRAKTINFNPRQPPPFSFDGTLVDGETSVIWYATHYMVASRFTVTLTDANTNDIDFTLVHNGVGFYTATITGGELRSDDGGLLGIEPRDSLYVSIAGTIDTGAGLVAQLFVV